MNNQILNMENVQVKTKKSRILLDIDEITVNSGELVAIVGPNGAGKSTFLQTVNLLSQFTGELKLFGQNVKASNMTELRRKCSYVFQDSLLLNDTVYNNIYRILKLRRLTHNEINKKVIEALANFSCEHLANRSANRLSGGEAQRVCIARAIATNPELLLLDEPSASLDPPMRTEMIRQVKEIAEENKITVILVSHNFTDVLHFAGRAIVLMDGKIVQDNIPEVLIRNPVNVETAKLVGMDNIIPCTIENKNGEAYIKLRNGVEFKNPNNFKKTISNCCITGDNLRIYNEVNKINPSNLVLLNGIVNGVKPDIGTYYVQVKTGQETFNIRVPRGELIKNGISKNVGIQLAFESSEVHLI